MPIDEEMKENELEEGTNIDDPEFVAMKGFSDSDNLANETRATETVQRKTDVVDL